MATPDKKRGRPQKASQALNKTVIVDKAKALMEAEHKIPSIRAIANALDVDAMALYHYFENKSALLEGITTSLITDVYNPKPKGSADWQTELTKLARSYISILHKYDGLLQTLLTMQSHSPAEVFFERFERIVAPLLLSREQEKVFLDLLVDYLHGFSVALSCDKTNTLTLDYMDKPLELLFRGVELIESERSE